MKSTILLFGLLLLLAGCTLPTVQSDLASKGNVTYKTYIVPTFSIEYPPDWQTSEKQGVVSLTSPKEGTDDSFLEGMSIVTAYGEERLDALEQAEISQLYQGERITSTERKTFRGQPALFIETEGPSEPGSNTQVYRKTMYLAKEGTTYRVGYAIEKSKIQKFKPILEKMLESFKPSRPFVQPSQEPAQPSQQSVQQVPEPREVTGARGVEYTYYSSPLFLLYYPIGWEMDDSESGIFIFASLRENADDAIREAFVVQIWAGNDSRADYYEGLEYGIHTSDVVVLNKGWISFKGREAYVIEMEDSDISGKTTVFYKSVFFQNGQWIYRLNYIIEKSKVDSYKPTMEDILGRIEIGSYG